MAQDGSIYHFPRSWLAPLGLIPRPCFNLLCSVFFYVLPDLHFEASRIQGSSCKYPADGWPPLYDSMTGCYVTILSQMWSLRSQISLLVRKRQLVPLKCLQPSTTTGYQNTNATIPKIKKMTIIYQTSFTQPTRQYWQY